MKRKTDCQANYLQYQLGWLLLVYAAWVSSTTVAIIAGIIIIDSAIILHWHKHVQEITINIKAHGCSVLEATQKAWKEMQDEHEHEE